MTTSRIQRLGIVLVILCATAVRAQDPRDQIEIARAKFLCSWKEGHVPRDSNEPPLDVCNNPEMLAGYVAKQVRDWWGHWEQLDEKAATALNKAFEDAWHQQRTWEAQEYSRVEEAKARAEARVNAAKHEAALAHTVALLPADQLCREYFRSHSIAVRSELFRRDAITSDEWVLISKKEIQIGMSELALICSWGPARANRMVTAHVTHKQYIYGNTYVYVENGKVVAFQD